MNPLSQLQTLGLELPSVAYLVGSVLFGLVGMVAWRHGRSTSRPVVKWTGLALMLYPYAVSETWVLWTLGAAMCVYLGLKWND